MSDRNKRTQESYEQQTPAPSGLSIASNCTSKRKHRSLASAVPSLDNLMSSFGVTILSNVVIRLGPDVTQVRMQVSCR